MDKTLLILSFSIYIITLLSLVLQGVDQIVYMTAMLGMIGCGVFLLFSFMIDEKV